MTVRVRPVTAAVFAVVLVVAAVTSTVIARIADEQDRRLLEERTGEVAVFLESSLREIELTFPFLAGVLQLAADPVTGFELAAESLVGDAVDGIGLATGADGDYEVTAAVGGGTAAGDPVGAELAALLDRAATAGDVVTAVLPSSEEGRTRVGLAFAAEGVPVRLFVELLFDPPAMIRQEPGSPFSDIRGAVYLGAEPLDSHLLITTADELPLTGDVVRDSISVGADEWLVVTSSDERLAGALAEQTRWGVLLGGLVLALLAATLVEILSRRRAYAFRLVDERTAALQEARHVAEDANRAKSEFLSRMSHELRTPLNGVLGFAQLLEIEPLEPDQRESVEQILKGGRHLLALINEVLDISRIEAGELALSPEAVAVPELLREVVDLLRPMASAGGIEILVDRTIDPELHVFADRQRVKQVLLNLVSNAVKYNRARGSVSISCSRPSETVVSIDVVDTGPGIPAEQLGKLFVAFERLGAENTGVEGTGIGLALSERLAEIMGGRLGVQSTLGQGSTFSLELPLVEGPVGRYERLHGGDERPPAAEATERRAVVLHIEDNLSNLKLVERVLAKRDVEVVAAMQGRLGLELAREHDPVLVLLDVHLPDMRGDEVLQRLRDDPSTARIPVVIVSADATAGNVQRLLSAGATAYLTKPIDVRQLLAALDDALA